ncbi:MAG TPA: SRPBCC domain-containing protein [Steroidobacteraceae bacterium]|nr:SRPBCC domain-containing protein [Steroidobacteraceae bacterium]
MKTTPDSSDSLVFECDLAEPPEKVWRALTEPALLEAWLMTEALPVADRAPASHQEATVPGTAQSRDGQDRGARQAGSSECELLTAEPHRFLRYRWRDRESGVGEPTGREVHSVVTVELVPCPAGGTHLRLTHGEFRLVSVAPVVAAARIVPITSARRRRTPTVSFAAQAYLRRAA